MTGQDYAAAVIDYIHPALDDFATALKGEVTVNTRYASPIVSIKWPTLDITRSIDIEVSPWYAKDALALSISAVWHASMIRQQWYNHERVETVPIPSDLTQLNLERLVAALTTAKDKVLKWTIADLRMDD